MSRRCRFGGLAGWAAVALALASPGAWAHAGDRTLARSCAPALPLVWVDGGRTPPMVLDEAAREAARIWGAAGITLAWSKPGPDRSIAPDAILVAVRTRLAGRKAAKGQRRRTALGRLIRVSPERPGRLIEVALPIVTDVVLPLRWQGRPVREQPQFTRDRAIGRALGRVVAHEIGHWLFGRDHAVDGLMRASIRRPDLVAADPPALPAAWPSTARVRLRTLRPCAGPHPVQPGAPS